MKVKSHLAVTVSFCHRGLEGLVNCNECVLHGAAQSSYALQHLHFFYRYTFACANWLSKIAKLIWKKNSRLPIFVQLRQFLERMAVISVCTGSELNTCLFLEVSGSKCSGWLSTFLATFVFQLSRSCFFFTFVFPEAMVNAI